LFEIRELENEIRYLSKGSIYLTVEDERESVEQYWLEEGGNNYSK
jgi:hypothetical protein